MKKLTLLIASAVALSVISACAPPAPKVSVPLEIQAIQKRDFETTKKIAFGSVVSVLQDLGYIIGNADFETGIITGNSPTSDTTDGATLLLSALAGTAASSSQSTTKVSAFIEEIRDGNISIRLNFVVNKTTSSAYGQTSGADTPILDEMVYIQAFEKIETAIFVRS